jgi:3-oxoacyl-[acyl-carrier protein] reductase
MTDLISLNGRATIVTGAAQGIGKAVTELVIKLGGRVIALDLNGDVLRDAVKSQPSERIMPVVGTVVDADLAERTLEEAVKRFGAVHGLVNNAGLTRPAMIEKMTSLQWQEVIDVHLTGAFYWLQAAGRHMVQRAKAGDNSGGSIVNITSEAGRRGSIGQINYAAAKAGMLGLTMSAAREWSKFNVRTNSVCFGVVETPMTEVIRGDKFRDGILAQIPMGRWAQPEEVVKTVCFLLSDASSYITGQHLGVNGGYHISV